jgi:two-component system, OmpR family, KDP operon response regulator KdpE
MTRVLVVDDEPHLLRALVLTLTNREYQVAAAANAAAALAEVAATMPDIVVLDLGLPDRDGIDVVRELQRDHPELPIVVLSARAGSHDKVLALDLGAVDYVTKPFDMNELLARVRAASRRTAQPVTAAAVSFGDVHADLRARTLKRGSQAVHLTPTEWRILDVLLRNPGRLIPARELLTAVRGDPEHTESSYLRIYIAQLRRKLEPEPNRPRHILTEPGVGYRFEPQAG